ncbi:MAG: peptidoglycan-binding protein [Propionibacteriaceae bacterium]|nr:peptidoglycan-binding protein [Propionibacteriaceae bacterium]
MQSALSICNGVRVGKFDSNWGPQTTGALTTFQRYKGIAADGEYGPQTHNAIGKWANVPPFLLTNLPASLKCISDSNI